MPRIEAASIAEHIQAQHARILDAATRLFHDRGYRDTDLDDIAREVGLARNSLYRYYPNKDFILLSCVERDMAAFVARMRALGSQHRDPVQRLGAWLDMQIDMAVSPAHASLEVMAEIRTDAPELKKRIMELHEAPARALETTVAELVRGRRRDTPLLIALIRGLVQAAAGVARHRDSPTAVKRELRRAVLSLIEA